MDVDINSVSPHISSPKKRVLFIITQSEMGGAQQFLIRLLRQLDSASYDIRVAMGRDGDGSLIEMLRPLGIISPVIPALRRNFHPLSDIRALFESRNLIRNFDPDTIFLLSSKAGFIGSWAARLLRSRAHVIYRIGGWTFNDPWPTWKKNLWIFLERLSAPWKDIIILNNAHDMAQAKHLGIQPRGGIHLIYNGIDPYKLQLLPKDEARQDLLAGTPFAQDHKKKLIGTIANFYPTKGLEYLIQAATELKDPEAVIVIIGDGAERSALEEGISRHGLTNRVILAGHRTEAARYLSAFEMFVLPSVKEGFPWAILEAMAAKLPVIATRVGAVPEIIEDGIQGYIVPPGDAAKLAEKIDVLLGNERMAQDMGIKAHQRILFSFTLDVMIRQVRELL